MQYMLLFLLLLTACSSMPFTNKNSPLVEIPLSTEQQEIYLSKSKPAQHFGFQVYPLPRGEVGLRGSARLHPNQRAEVAMSSTDPFLIPIMGKNKKNNALALLDTASPTSWLEFAYSRDLLAKFLSFRDHHFPYRGQRSTGGVNAYVALVHQLRIHQIFIDNIPLYVRMATGSLGPQGRSLEEPQLKAVLGYDVLQLFSIVQIDFPRQMIRFSTTDSYTPNAMDLLATASIINHPQGGLVVEGALFGEKTPIVLDLAGAYALARPDMQEPYTRQLSIDELVFRQIPTLPLPPGNLPYLGRELLDECIVTLCPQAGYVYIEKP
jgi:hypothetical protein